MRLFVRYEELRARARQLLSRDPEIEAALANGDPEVEPTQEAQTVLPPRARFANPIVNAVHSGDSWQEFQDRQNAEPRVPSLVSRLARRSHLADIEVEFENKNDID